MNVARILYPVEVLGPGKRIGIWMRGCEHKCPGCSNPELWVQDHNSELSIEQVMFLIKSCTKSKIPDGYTITGGDPFFDPSSLLELLTVLHEETDDIIVYTGYTIAELKVQNNPIINDCLSLIGVLIDGRYVESKNDGILLRGSNNQQIIVLKSNLKKKYSDYFAVTEHNYIQNFETTNGVVSVGIHNPNFMSEMAAAASKRGVIING